MCQEKNNSYKAQCPQCSAALYISGTSEAYKCPVCGKLFTVRFMKKYTKVLREGTKEEVCGVDITLGENLDAAVENLPPLSEEDANEIYPGRFLTAGEESPQVRVLQTFLARASELHDFMPPVTVDGIFGTQTERTQKTL